MFLYDLITGNNMRGPTPSLFIPGPPSSVPLKLENLPTNLDKVLKSVSPAGTLVTGSNRGKSFFYEGPNASTQAGRALSGECVALKDLNDRPLAIGNLGALWPFSPAYDIGRKATHIASTPAQFLQYFTTVKNGNLVLDLKNGIVSVTGNSIQLQAPPGGKILFLNSGILIASDGEILVKSPLQRDTTNATGTMVVATAKDDKHITLCPGRFQAFFISSGTLKRESAGAIQIEGGVAVKYLEFKKTGTSIFAGYPSGADARQTITWDKKFDVFDPNSYTQRAKLHLGGSLAYWAVEKATD